MAAKLTRLIHKIAIQLHIVTAVPFAVLAPDGQARNFWIHPHTCMMGSNFAFISSRKPVVIILKQLRSFCRFKIDELIQEHGHKITSMNILLSFQPH
jgi:hypothetical protein